MIDHEYGGEAPVCCPVCEASTEDGCDHVLLCFDETFDECEGGICYDGWWNESRQRVETVFKAILQSGREPKWKCPFLADAWEAVLDARRDNEGARFLHPATATDLLVYALEEAGGAEVGAGLIGSSGGRCESKYRLLYAEKPRNICARATALLEQCLAEPKIAEQ